ncbi:MAG: type II secretion system GspH family protein [Gemmatimonadaceae bacterium]|jgi:Tfp pilus assembly protein PilV|nr:type II secretion system GspH family protein [Gemmatimonadaceae bacterium]
MTLLESLIALVILALAATGFLELFQRAAAASHDRIAWQHAVAIAESTMERALVDGEVPADSAGWRRRVERRPAEDGLQELVVRVERANASALRVELHRLVRAR